MCGLVIGVSRSLTINAISRDQTTQCLMIEDENVLKTEKNTFRLLQ